MFQYKSSFFKTLTNFFHMLMFNYTHIFIYIYISYYESLWITHLRAFPNYICSITQHYICMYLLLWITMNHYESLWITHLQDITKSKWVIAVCQSMVVPSLHCVSMQAKWKCTDYRVVMWIFWINLEVSGEFCGVLELI